MKPGIPWSVKGIEQQARAAAKQAARQSGMTIGEWLNSVILDSAEGGDDLERRYRRPPYRPKPLPSGEHGQGEEVTLRLEEIAEQLHSIARQESDTAVSRNTSPEDEAALRAIVERLDAYEQHTSSALGAMQERLEQVSERLGRQPEHKLPDRAEDVPGYPALEGALRNIIEHIEVSETRTRDSIVSLQERLAEMMASRDVPGRNDLGEVREAEQRLRSLVEEAKQASGAMDRSDDLAQLQGDIDSLNQRFDDMKVEAVSDRDVDSLRLEIEQLATTVSQASGHALSDLEQRVQSVEAELKSEVAERHSGSEQQIAALSERIGATEQRLAHLDTIERSVAQLAHSLETSRSAAAEVETSDQPAGGSAELKALEDGLQAVRASAELADRRTQDTLQAVHETLEQIVAKLAELEAHDGPDGEEPDEEPTGELAPEPAGDPAGELAREPAEEPAGEFAPEPAKEPAGELAREPAEEPAGELAREPAEEPAGELAREPAEEPAEEASTSVDAELESAAAPQPEEPATQPEGEADEMPATAAGAEHFAFTADRLPEDTESGSGTEPRVEAPDGPASDPYGPPAQPAEAPVREDYIAAARRAAQMAAMRNQNPVTSGFNRFSQRFAGGGPRPSNPADASAPSRSFVSSLVGGLRSGKGKSSDEPQPDGKKSKRKRLILAGLVLLAAVSAYGAHRHAGSIPAFNLFPGPLSGPAAAPADVEKAASPQSLNAIPDTARQQAEGLPEEIGPESLRRAAASGDVEAQFVVASRYLEGKDVARDEEQAAQWYRRAAMQGLAVAQYRLGSMYEHGRGMPLDREAAQVWYQKAAERGNVTAMHNLAVLYADASIGRPRYELAADWFRKAAERGLKDSQFNLAVLSEQGLGLPHNPQEAVFWYALAAAQGDPEAAAKAKSLESSLAPEGAKRIHNRLLAWRPLPADRAANFVPVGDPSGRS